MTVTIEAVCAKIPDWQGKNVAAKPLSGGLTNTNYRVVVEGLPYFVRVPGAKTELLAVEVYLVYTDFINMVRQVPRLQKLLPLEFREEGGRVVGFTETKPTSASYIYEPGQNEILDEIIPRFTALQVYHAILESLASEHAARMVAMKNATDSATELAGAVAIGI